MLIKVIGAVLILISCGSVGFCMAAAHRREESIMDSLCNLLLFMENELQYRLTPLPELCIATAQQTSGVLKNLFLLLEQELNSQISPDADSCMRAAVCRCSGLPQRAQQCLLELGKTLGMFDIDGQIKGLKALQGNCELRLQQLRFNKNDRLRGYQTLGLCAGAAIVILFI